MALSCGGADDGESVAGPTGSDSGSDAGSSSGAPDGGESTAIADTTADTTAATGTGVVEVDYAGQIQPIWDAACTCHLQGPSGMMTASTLTLNAEASYAELVGISATQAALPRVQPGDLEGSYLWHKLHGTQADVEGTGTAMPQIGALDPSDLQLIEAWILGGAPP